jgi:chemotaxis protein histidine kinase CheA
MDSGQFFGPFMDDYFAECDEHLASLRHLLLELEEEGAGPVMAEERLRRIFRSLHTLKGLSGMVGFAESEAVAHSLEDWLRSTAPAQFTMSRSRLDDLLNRDRAGSDVPADELEEIDVGMERQLRELREGVMRVRLIPIGEAFDQLGVPVAGA